MSLGESDAKFPNQSNSGEAPSPTRENPGAVYPKSSPTAAEPQEIPGSRGAPSNPSSVLSNPFEFREELNRLETALDRVINVIEGEMPVRRDMAEGGQPQLQTDAMTLYAHLRNKFQQWKEEIAKIRGTGAGGDAPDGDGINPDIGISITTRRSDNTNEGGLFND